VKKQTPETFLPGRHGNATNLSLWGKLFNARSIEQAFRSALGQEPEANQADDVEQLKTPNIFRVCAQSVAIMENLINELHISQNPQDLIIRPTFDGITLLEFHRAKEIIAAGESSARAALPEIEYLLNPA
jgi:NTE family protein